MFLVAVVFSHMKMTIPKTRGETYDNGPISAAQFPCKGLPVGTATSLKAGSSVQTLISGSASHKGGVCQFSLSYDEKKFIVVHSEYNCPSPNANYNVKLPSNIPNGKAIFAWSWMNEVGNREFYMNCADVEITGSTGSDFQGPEILVGNIENNGKLISLPDNQVVKTAKPLIESAPNTSFGNVVKFQETSTKPAQPAIEKPIPPQSTTAQEPAKQPVAPPVASQHIPPVITPVITPAPAAQTNQFTCSSDGKSYNVNGYTMAMAAGTKCVQNGFNISVKSL